MRSVADRQPLRQRHADAIGERHEDLLERFRLLEHVPQRLLFPRRRVGQALVVLVVAVGEVAQHHGRRTVEGAGLLELDHHPVDAVEGFVDVFEEDDFSFARVRVGGSGKRCPQGKIPSDQLGADRFCGWRGHPAQRLIDPRHSRGLSFDQIDDRVPLALVEGGEILGSGHRRVKGAPAPALPHELVQHGDVGISHQQLLYGRFAALAGETVEDRK